MTLYLLFLVKLVVIVGVIYGFCLYGKFLNTSNTRIGIWMRKKFGPTVQSAGHVIQREDLKAVGYCPSCGSAIKENQAVWLIAQIPSSDEDVAGKLTQAHCIFYVDALLLRVAICLDCQTKNHHPSTIFAVLGSDGKPSKKSPMFGRHRIDPEFQDIYAGIARMRFSSEPHQPRQ